MQELFNIIHFHLLRVFWAIGIQEVFSCADGFKCLSVFFLPAYNKLSVSLFLSLFLSFSVTHTYIHMQACTDVIWPINGNMNQTDTSQNKYKWSISIWKNIQHLQPSEKCKSKLHWGSDISQNSYHQEYKTISTDEESGESEPLCTSDGNVNQLPTM